jgi:putative membrane protein
MVSTFLTVLATALSLLVVDIIFPGVVIANFPAAMLAAVVVGFINGSVKPIFSALSLPINIVTLGAFSLVVNGFCFWLASVIVPGFAVRGLAAFIVGPVILSLTNTLINNYFAEKNPALNSTDNMNRKVNLPSN